MVLRRSEVGERRRTERFLGRWLGGTTCREDAAAAANREEGLSIAIASGKGGTGKSFLATSLAVALHQGVAISPSRLCDPKRRVALVDCDFGLACDHLLLGAKPTKTLQHVISGGARFEDTIIETEHGPRLVPGGSGVQRMANLGRAELAVLGSELGALVCAHDVILLDIGAGISPQTVLPMSCADHVILVTQPEIAALTDAYAVIKCLAAQCQRSPFSIVVNRVAEIGQGDKTFEKLAEVARRFTGVELHYLGEVIEDPAVTQRRLGQPPLVVSDPECATSRSIHLILDRLRAVVGSFRPRSVEASLGFGARFQAQLSQMF